ncbi:MAG: cold shock domain-containing protein [Sphingomicrobium sp.]
MPIDGLLTKWNDDRGFGFITSTVGSQEIFIHISAFPKDSRWPKVGELLSFEPETSATGRMRAKSVSRPTRACAVRAGPREYAVPRRGRSLLGRMAAIAIMIAIGIYGSNRYSQDRNSHRVVEEAVPVRVESTVAVPKPTTSFQCDGRKYYSQMTSCVEATIFLKNCPGTQMDGDHDGIPCDRQWC